MWVGCDVETDCFWGYCVHRTYNGLTGESNDGIARDLSLNRCCPGGFLNVAYTVDYCTWKPGPCVDNTDCDNGLLCSPVNKMCGGPGASCTDNNQCGDPYPCQDNGAGQSFCAGELGRY
jgi:hypothetical protein